MKLKFDSNLEYQLEAIQGVTDLFEGLPQQQVASKLGLSKAAVSQYVSAKRGKEITFSQDIEERIQELAESLVEELAPNEAVSNLCAVCRDIQASGWLCREHLQKNGSCTYCLEK